MSTMVINLMFANMYHVMREWRYNNQITDELGVKFIPPDHTFQLVMT